MMMPAFDLGVVALFSLGLSDCQRGVGKLVGAIQCSLPLG
jgi:hypothetical protein